jgi:hypothetical protein
MSQRLTVRLVAPTGRAFFDASEPVHALAAEKDGRRSTSLLGRTCYLQDLFTTEEARGQGVGSCTHRDHV